jgi:hypothetical protein
MKEMRNIADRGGKHHDPMHGPPGTWVYGLEGVGTTVGGEQEMPEARTPEDFSRAGATPVCAALGPPQTRFVPPVTSGVAPALGELPSVMRSSRDENLESADRNAVKSAGRNHGILIHSPKNQAPKQQITVKVYQDQLATLDKYGRFIDDSRDYIISQALELVFKRDKEFCPLG